MNCPRCTTAVLSEIDRDGITVDLCPGCRGVWLDRGELERLRSRWLQELEKEFGGGDPRAPRAAAPPLPHRDAPLPPAEPVRRSYRDDDDDDDDDDDRRRSRDAYDRDRYSRDQHPPRKRRWFEMFDVFD